MLDWMRMFAQHPDPLVEASNWVALLIGTHLPFWPLYVWWSAGAQALPSALWTLALAPAFMAIPLISRRSGLLGRVATVLLGAAAAHAERRVFIVANNPDGYGVDRCLNSGASCGAPVANAYCHSHEFAQALSFEKIDRDDITGAIPSTGPDACHGTTCSYIAIICTR